MKKSKLGLECVNNDLRRDLRLRSRLGAIVGLMNGAQASLKERYIILNFIIPLHLFSPS